MRAVPAVDVPPRCFGGKILPELEKQPGKKVLFIATGALMSPLSIQQGESIPCIAHLVELSSEE